MKVGDMVLMVRKIVGETITPEGNKVYQTRWERVEGDISIGSMKDPKNKDIIEFKWVKENPFNGLFF